MTNLIVIEGQDRTGKDTLLTDLKNSGFPTFSPDTSKMPDYHGAEEFRKALKIFLKKQVEDMEALGYKTLYIARFQLSEYVYSELFNRTNLFESDINELINDKFKIHNIILLWDTYDDYLKRLNMIGEEIEYNEEDFNLIKELYLKYKSDTDIVIYIKWNTTREQLLKSENCQVYY